MHTPPAYAQQDTAQPHAFMRAHSFATLVTQGRDGLNATPLPFVLDDGAGPHGRPTTHLARAPAELVAPRLRAVADLHTPSQLDGKMALDQDKSMADRRGVVAAQETMAVPGSLAVAPLILAQPDRAVAVEEPA